MQTLKPEERKILVKWLNSRSAEGVNWNRSDDKTLLEIRQHAFEDISGGYNVPRIVKDYFREKGDLEDDSELEDNSNLEDDSELEDDEPAIFWMERLINWNIPLLASCCSEIGRFLEFMFNRDLINMF